MRSSVHQQMKKWSSQFAEQSLGTAMTLLLFVLILVPLGALLIQVFFPGFFWGGRHFAGFSSLLGIFDNRLWRVSMENSLLLSIGSATFAVCLGGLLAMVRTFWAFPSRSLLDVTAWVLLITPSFILAQGWILFASHGGIAGHWFHAPWVASLIFRPIGLMIVMTLSKYSLAYLAVSAALGWNVSHYEDAARLCGARPWRVWRTVHIPLLIPAFVAGWALVFVEVIGDFGLPAALSTVHRFPTLPYSIYTAINATPTRFDQAGVLALYLIVLIGAAMWLVFYTLKRANYDFLNSRAVVLEPKPVRFRWILTALNVIFLVIALGIPIGTSLIVSFVPNISMVAGIHQLTLQHYRDVLSSDASLIHGLRNSLIVAGIAAVVSVVVGFVMSYVLIFTKYRLKALIEVGAMISLAVPGVVLGVGYIFIWNQKWLVPLHLNLYGTPSILVLAAISGAIPFSVRLQVGSFTQIPANMLHAGAVQGAGRWLQMRDVLLPLVRKSLLAAVLASFGSSIFDLAMSMTLAPPGFSLLPIDINTTFEQLRYGYSTASTMLGCAVVIGLILLVDRGSNYLFSWSDKRKERPS